MKDKHAVSRMIFRLEKNGWIEKTSSEFDGRVTFISLTNEGKAVREEMHEILSKTVKKEIFNHFTEEEKDFILSIMKKMRSLMKDDFPNI